MNAVNNRIALYGVLLVASIVAPYLFPAYTLQFANLWVMVLFALTWDAMGGQMGYNSLGNIVFFGVGMYISAILQVGLYFDVGEYTSAYGAIKVDFDYGQYFTGLTLGVVAAAFGAMIVAVGFGRIVLGLRGPYFAIGTLGVALSAGELLGAWEWVGAGSGISMPVYPGDPDDRSLIFYFMCFGAAAATFLFYRWLYTTRFGLALNSIRDDEEKAEAMGVHTVRYKIVNWSMSAFFLGISGAIYGNMIGFIEPLEVAFPTVTFGIFMVLMALMGGKGTLWGPVIGATVFHVIKEVTWTHLLGWQWVALGLLIIVIVVYFPQGIMGWAHDRWPAVFGIESQDVANEDSREPA